ncbi:hypothetical protein ANANG_G00285390 [Anguilla anguilla]|uniref:Uncharacterized protein n=1 Tax=Anguilla anguilla TaxID=7936 RepID=A0A9D3LSI3_ANGAN|nr:hypothetical protein ANANG_G00285390 [Anguilla anguilla]
MVDVVWAVSMAVCGLVILTLTVYFHQKNQAELAAEEAERKKKHAAAVAATMGGAEAGRGGGKQLHLSAEQIERDLDRLCLLFSISTEPARKRGSRSHPQKHQNQPRLPPRRSRNQPRLPPRRSQNQPRLPPRGPKTPPAPKPETTPSCPQREASASPGRRAPRRVSTSNQRLSKQYRRLSKPQDRPALLPNWHRISREDSPPGEVNERSLTDRPAVTADPENEPDSNTGRVTERPHRNSAGETSHTLLSLL